MVPYVFCLSLVLAAGEQREPPPLTEAQRARLTKLVQTTRQRAADLKEKLVRRQNELTKLYAEFKLDQARAASLQKEILELQKELLVNYHQMQVELRSIVGRDRFIFLQKRLARVLGVDGPKDQKRPTNKSK